MPVYCLPNRLGTHCRICGRVKPVVFAKWPRMECRVMKCGSSLRAALQYWFGQAHTAQCGCGDRVAQMNAWGPKGCRENLDTIVGWLWEESQKRDWKFQGRMWWTVPAANALRATRRWRRTHEWLMRWGIRQFVIWMAIRPAERIAFKSARKTTTSFSQLASRQ